MKPRFAMTLSLFLTVCFACAAQTSGVNHSCILGDNAEEYRDKGEGSARDDYIARCEYFCDVASQEVKQEYKHS